jgi:hypothetical protein
VTSWLRLRPTATVRTRGRGDPMHAATAALGVRSCSRRWEVWRQWVVYTTTAYVLSGIVITVVSGSVPGGLAVGFMAVVVGLAIVGLLQWLVLRYWVHGLRWRSWVLATVLGHLAGTSVVTVAVLGSLATGTLGGLGGHVGEQTLQLGVKFIFGALSGGVEGFAQWLVLRRYLRTAGWWIVAMMAAEALAAAASLVASRGAAFDGLAALVITRLTSGFIVAATTGAVLAWLLRQRQAIPASG